MKNSSIEEIFQLSSKTHSLDLKRYLIDFIIEICEEDYPQILKSLLFEVPVKAHRYIIQELMSLSHEDVLKDFFAEICMKYRDYPEVFLWLARAIFSQQWNYSWLQYNHKDIFLFCFRLLKILEHTEIKGTRLKNQALEIIFGTTHLTIEEMSKKEDFINFISSVDSSVLRRIYALFRDINFVALAYKENLLALIQREHPDFILEESYKEEQARNLYDNYINPKEDSLLVSSLALEKYRKLLDHLINVEMPANSHDIGEAQEKGDLRENAEYKAALEKQSQLQAEISKLSEELKHAEIIDLNHISQDRISVGTHVLLQTEDMKKREYTILGPWDADSDQSIISYASPLAKSLLGKKEKEEVSLLGLDYKFKIIKISVSSLIT